MRWHVCSPLTIQFVQYQRLATPYLERERVDAHHVAIDGQRSLSRLVLVAAELHPVERHAALRKQVDVLVKLAIESTDRQKQALGARRCVHLHLMQPLSVDAVWRQVCHLRTTFASGTSSSGTAHTNTSNTMRMARRVITARSLGR